MKQIIFRNKIRTTDCTYEVGIIYDIEDIFFPYVAKYADIEEMKKNNIDTKEVESYINA